MHEVELTLSNSKCQTRSLPTQRAQWLPVTMRIKSQLLPITCEVLHDLALTSLFLGLFGVPGTCQADSHFSEWPGMFFLQGPWLFSVYSALHVTSAVFCGHQHPAILLASQSPSRLPLLHCTHCYLMLQESPPLTCKLAEGRGCISSAVLPVSETAANPEQKLLPNKHATRLLSHLKPRVQE